jgi:molecular chaperone GrpE
MTDDTKPTAEEIQNIPNDGKEETTPRTLEHLEEKLQQCERECAEYLDGWKRAKADFVNYKKEEVARFEALAKFSNETLVRELISILDSFELGFAVLREEDPARKGMFLIQAQLGDLLRRYGLTPIVVSIGEHFDPTRHEAVGEVVSPHSGGAVVEEVGRGYLLHGKVIRPSRVNVSKGS